MHTPDQQVCLCAYPPPVHVQEHKQVQVRHPPSQRQAGLPLQLGGLDRSGGGGVAVALWLNCPTLCGTGWNMDSGIGRVLSSLWNQKYPPVDGRISRRTAQKLRRAVKDFELRDFSSSPFVFLVAFHDLDAVDKLDDQPMTLDDSACGSILVPHTVKVPAWPLIQLRLRLPIAWLLRADNLGAKRCND
ncbi:hypothetical protein CSAL01_10583 [Colletotrichum salicis]|uniref:Uncharacterized protein n=1 Tax=Colletotrichum salicis TaxID=1209931 RepID=A0A135S852_9PEZI|nr:hypothetical protein CSAL01_10583 [Colletotrichum salicis]